MQYAHIDTKRADGTYVKFARVIEEDDCQPRDPREQDEGMTDERAEAYRKGDWHFIGIRAFAYITVVRNGVGTMYRLESAGLWGTESDADEAYLEEIFAEQKAELLADMAMFANVTII